MATKPRKSAPEPVAETQAGDPMFSVLEELRALRQEVSAFRHEVRVLAEQPRPERERRGVDPGDSVPPGVAVEEAVPLEEADRKAKRSLNRLSRRRSS